MRHLILVVVAFLIAPVTLAQQYLWEFEQDLGGWAFWQNSSWGTLERASSGCGTTAAKLSVTQSGSNVQFFRRNLTLYANTQYALSFQGRVGTRMNAPRDVQVQIIKDNSNPWVFYGLTPQTKVVEASCGSFTIVFTTPNFPGGVVHDARLMFWLSYTAITGDYFYFDNIHLQTTTSPLCADLVRNGDFTAGTAHWTHYNPAYLSFTVASGRAQLRVNNIPSDGNLQLYQTPHTLVAGYRYKLEFDAASSNADDIHVSLIKHSSPFSTYFGRDVNLSFLGPEGQLAHYTYEFQSPVTASDVRLRFYMGWRARQGTVYWIDNVSLYPLMICKDQIPGSSPEEYALQQNFPNPFNPTTTISFSIPKEGSVSLKVFDVLGREVALLVNGERPAGTYSEVFDASALASGIYFYRLESDGIIMTKKMMLLK